jgi:membrane protease YdiL (CAAX protease family)
VGNDSYGAAENGCLKELSMENTANLIKKNWGKEVLIIIMALAFIIVILYWMAINTFHLEALPLYFMQLGLYLFLFLLALRGLRQEQITLPINARRILEALIGTLVSWLFFLLFIQLLGLAKLPEEFQALQNSPVWRTGAKVLSTWFFVGIGEEVLFRGYFLQAVLQHFTSGTTRRRKVAASLLVSAVFSIWHLPNRILWLMSGEIDLVLFLISLFVLFLLGLGYTYLFVRSENILLAGLVHGVSDFPLVGMQTQMTPILLLVAIGYVEITHLIARRKLQAIQS